MLVAHCCCMNDKPTTSRDTLSATRTGSVSTQLKLLVASSVCLEHATPFVLNLMRIDNHGKL